MFKLSKEKSVGFLKEAIIFLEEKVVKLENENAALKELCSDENAVKKQLMDELAILKKRYFDSLSERGKKDKIPRKKRDFLKLIHNKNPLGELQLQTEGLDEIETIHKLIDKICSFCSSNNIKKMNGCYEESREIEIIEKKFIIKKHLREKWICQDCNKITTAKGGLKLIPGGKYSIELAISIVIDKFLNHIPLDRQRKMMARNRLYIDTKTIFGITDHLERLLESIPKLILKEILSQKTTYVDESPMNIFHPERQKGYIWSVSNNYGQYYQYELTRSGDVAKEMLKGFSGIVVSDAYGGYNFLYFMKEIIHSGCWAHSRRKFVEAEITSPIAQEMVDLTDKLYAIERKAQDFKHLQILRESESTIIVNEIELWLKKYHGKYLKKSAIGKAIKYLERGLRPFESKGKIVNKNQVGALKEFLNNEYVPLDNNAAERSQRDPVMGRKNYNGFRTLDGADTAMTFYTIIGTCKRLEVPPWAYLKEMAMRSLQGKIIITPFQFGRELQDVK